MHEPVTVRIESDKIEITSVPGPDRSITDEDIRNLRMRTRRYRNRRIGERPYAIEYGYYHGYAKMDKEGTEPAYPFGYGLSYTTFAMKNASVQKLEDRYTVRVSVENTGKTDGTEVVQVYAASCGAADGSDRPVKLLKGFCRVELKAGETGDISIEIPKDELRFRKENGWVTDFIYKQNYAINYAVCRLFAR